MRFILSTAALALALVVPATAASADDQATVTVRVDVADIDLTSAEGRDAAEARLEEALRTACTYESTLRYFHGRSVLDQKCITEARAAARAQVERVAMNAARSSGTVAAN